MLLNPSDFSLAQSGEKVLRRLSGKLHELDRVRHLAAANGAERQRLWAREDGLVELVSKLTQRFTAPSTRSRQRTPSALGCEGEFR